ncbi:response regulator [Asticcacaulis solisilvae]|uniref:response regulator n=1 Tax=Asticcacaulis solisilvae TaxID=1217274 RepID=UPI003FD80693
MNAGRQLLTLRRHPAFPYGLAAGLALLALAVRIPFGQALLPFPFLTFYPAVLLAAVLNGRRAGVACAVLSGILAWLFVLPPEQQHFRALFPTGGVGFTGFAVTTGLSIWLLGRLRSREGLLKETASGLDALIENAPIGFAFIGRDGRYVRVNMVMARVAGLSMAEHIGRTPEEAAPDMAAPIRAAVDRVLTSGEAEAGIELEGRSAAFGGETRTWLASVFPVRGAEGQVAMAGISAIDITDRKRGETAVRQTNAALEGAIRDAQAALTQAQKMEAVGQLTGGIAHDFNNLLGTMVGSFDLIRRKSDNPAMVTRFADMGLQAAERGTRLTAQLLAFSRVQKLEVRPVAVSSVLRDAQALLERTLGPMIRLQMDIDPEELRVLSDATQLEMAVLNLAINARDAMPDGGGLTLSARRLKIGHDAELAPGDYAEITVADTGEGMSEAVASRAFDPFFTTKAVGKGTGLGLSQVYGIARQGGGTARIESAPGQGTKVRLLLPLVAPEAVVPGAGDAGAGEDTGARRAARVLVIDDDALMRETLAEALQTLGHEVTVASEGEEGLNWLKREAPDVIILDFAMPGMNGAEVASAAAGICPGVPIVFSTGYSNTTAIEAAAGRDAIVLRKPFMIETLDRTIGAVLGMRA